MCSAMERHVDNQTQNMLKCDHSTIQFHHSIPVEHSTDSIPPGFKSSWAYFGLRRSNVKRVAGGTGLQEAL